MSFARLALVALTGSLLLALPAMAQAAPPGCGQVILADARDGRVDRVYPISCYRRALETLPEDVRVYGTAEGDIQRALMGAVSRSASLSEGRVSSAPTRSAAGASSWLALAAGIGVAVGLIALVSLHSVRARRRH